MSNTFFINLYIFYNILNNIRNKFKVIFYYYLNINILYNIYSGGNFEILYIFDTNIHHYIYVFLLWEKINYSKKKNIKNF